MRYSVLPSHSGTLRNGAEWAAVAHLAVQQLQLCDAHLRTSMTGVCRVPHNWYRDCRAVLYLVRVQTVHHTRARTHARTAH